LFIYDLFEDSAGNIWAGTDAGIAVCSLVEDKVNVRVIDSDDGLPDIIIKKIKRLEGDTLALASEDAGIILLDTKSNHVRQLVERWEPGSVSDFLVKENQVWISVPRKGIAIIDRRSGEQKLFRESQNINLQSINALLKDRENNIWLASKTGVLRTPGDAVEHLEDLQPLRDPSILAVAVDSRHRIWFSTAEGLFVRSPEGSGHATIERKLRNTPYQDAPIISLYADAHGFIWAGMYGSGLLRIDPVTNRIKHFDNELRNGNILSITGRGDHIWIATLGGSSSIELKGGQYKVTNYGSDDGLSSDFIYQVFLDSRNRVWFASDGKGVSMFDERGFHHIDEGLPSRVVYSFAEDSNGDIYVTSQDNGVLKFDNNKFVTVPEMRLRDNSVQSLLADRDGNLIMTHNFGIDVFDVNKKTMRYWGEESGIRDKHANLNAVAVDKFGQFYIGTTKGIVKFSLRNDRTSTMPLPAIDQFLIHGEPVNLAQMPQLSYNENNVTIHYLGFWYQNTESVNFLYKLDNYDLEWINTRNQQVTYSRLPPGEYTFRVKASDTENFSDVPETSVTFSISPPFWRTSAFYVFAVGFFVISAYGLMKFRERKLLEAKIILEAKVEERTKEIQQKTEEIQAQNEEIMAQAEEIQGINENLEMLVKQRTAELEKKNKALEEYAFINAHKLRSPVASILGLVNLLQKGEQKDDRVIREHLQQSADKLDAIVRSITQAIEKADNNYP
ncbi:MAG TPA: two-component regulator propeller domain-containing protein, partial [Chryseosolibacter sp.]|nr:two-component regulator propeller domain-containing protein [Chryseosolibacter sp.]